MGNAAKVVLVGAATLIVGVYGVSLKTVQGNDAAVALSQTARVQNERAEDAAVRATLDRVIRAPYYGKSDMVGPLTALGGGTFSVSYSSDYPVHGTYSGHATLTMSQSGDTKIIDVWMAKQTSTKPGFRHITRGQWQVTNYHVRSLF